MSRILFAWEMGANYGHLARDLPIALRLRNSGHLIAFAVRDTRIAAEVLAPHGISFVQAPISSYQNAAQDPPASYAEILLAHGYGNEKALMGMTLAWTNLYALTKPNLIIADYAPTALFAAKLKAIAALAIGTGFEIPPASDPTQTTLPSLRPFDTIDQTRLRGADDVVNTSLAKIGTALGCNTPLSFCQLFEHAVLTTFPELDHCGERPGANYVGSIHSLPQTHFVSWDDNKSLPRVFAYLRPSMENLEVILSALSRLDALVVCCIPGLSAVLQQCFRSPHMKIYDQPLQIQTLLQHADCVVSYGGAGIVAESLLAGVPLVFAPQLAEQRLGAMRVEQLGAGMLLHQPTHVIDVLDAVNAVLEDAKYRGAAKAFAEKNRHKSSATAIERCAKIIEGMLKVGVNGGPLFSEEIKSQDCKNVQG